MSHQVWSVSPHQRASLQGNFFVKIPPPNFSSQTTLTDIVTTHQPLGQEENGGITLALIIWAIEVESG